MIYLDYTAHMPPTQQALDALVQAETRCIGNANAHHAAGSAAHAVMDDALTRIASLLRVSPQEVIFTSGASEGNNTAIQGIVYAQRHYGRHIITSPLEHASVSGTLTALQERGYQIDVLPLGKDGRIPLDALRDALRPDTVLVTLCAVDSELGAVQPVEEAAAIIKSHPHCRLHVDATQAIGKIHVPLNCADTVTLSGHKFGGITGSGVLIKKNEIDMEPLIHGGVSTSLYRSGTPAVGLAASLCAALNQAMAGMQEHCQAVRQLNDYLRAELHKRGVRINSPTDAIPHILNVGIDGIKGADMRDRLNERGICVSVKSACSVESTPSRAVYAVTGNRRQALESWRIGLSHQTTMQELNELLAAIDEIMGA